MSITRDFKLSLVAGRSVPLVINANQYDHGEIWRFTLLDENGQKYSPSTGSIIGLKSDGHIIANAGTVSSTGLVIISETEQMTASPGKNFYELLIDDDTHGTANFIVFVEPRPGADGTPSDSDLAVFQEAIDAAAQIGDASELVDDVAVLKSRMDEFTTLTDGSTTGDAELADIRVGADGTIYPNAGDAVRGQVSDLKNALTVVDSEIFERGDRITIPSSQLSPSYYLDGTGKCVNQSGYKMLKYQVTAGDKIWIYATKDSAGTYQFQSNNSVPSSLPNNYLIGTPKTSAINEVVTVPNGATWVIISALSDNTTSGLYKFTTVTDVTDDLQSQITTLANNVADNDSILYERVQRITIPDAQVAYSYYLNANGTCTNNSSYKMLKYEVTAGTKIWIYATAVSSGVFQFQNTSSVPSSGTNTGLIGSTYTQAIDGVITVPEGATWLIISADRANADVGCYTYDNIKNMLKNLELEDVPANLENARHVAGNTATPLTLLHFSDLHADTNALSRIMEEANNMAESIDDAICTGDMVANTGGAIASWWDSSVMTCIGNHESATYNSETGYDWTAISMADRDTYYIAPFESEWGITHTTGTSYYYKDYSEQKVRMIVMDGMLYTDNGAEATAQTTWLEGLLADAITNDLHVLIAIHAPHGGATAIDCSFSRYGQTTMPTYADCNTPQAVIDAVATKITAGLKFIGYIVGHTHQDNMWDAEGDGKQLMYCVTCSAVAQIAQWRNSDQHRGVCLDAYNLVTIDTAHSLLKIVRGGGANIDDHMRARKAICFDYSTGEVVGEIL